MRDRHATGARDRVTRPAHAAGTQVCLTALRSSPSEEASFIESYSAAYLHRWVLDLTSGACVAEETLCPVPLEFPALDGRLVGRDARYG